VNTIVDIRSYTTARGVPTIVFVDMQREYLAAPRIIAIPEIEEALENCRKLLAHARSYGLPIAFVRWLDRATPFFNRATPFSGWIEGFEPQRNEMIFERNRPSCYSSGGFAELMEHGNNEVVLAGFAGESACLSTMVDAFHRNHHMTYMCDASASHRLLDMPHDDVHLAVTRIAALYGDVARTDTWIGLRTRSYAANDGLDGTFAG
jgi:nicotinamidase-related amidase